MADNERLHILEMLDQGQITTEQALTLIQALEVTEAEPPLPGETPVLALPPDPMGSPEADVPSPSAAARPSPAPESFAPEPEDAPPGVNTPSSFAQEARSTGTQRRFRSFWLIPLWVGAGITVLGGLLMYLAWQSSGFGFWFACAWFPFTLGVLALIFAWLTRGMPWLHLRVHQPGGEGPHNIVLSFPLPLGLAGWGLRTFGHRIPGLEHTNVDEMI